MTEIFNFFSINSTFFTLFDYPMSYIEFFGTIFTIWCVWLTARAKVLSWPVGIVGSILYLFLFYQIRLYSDFFEQVYFLLTGFWGWWVWLHPRTKQETNINKQLKITLNSKKENVKYFIIVILGTAILTFLASNLNFWLPKYFPDKAAYPFLDAFTTILSFVAQWLLVRKKVESWALWIVVDLIGIWLYWVKGVKFISAEYVLFLVIACFGLVKWLKTYLNSKSHE